MTKHLGPIDVECDAPPYNIVQACKRVGIKRPEDVAWHRGVPLICTAELERCTFTYDNGKEVAYFIGQCDMCGTVFWDYA